MRPLGLPGINIGARKVTTPFESLHPRAAGGKFGAKPPPPSGGAAAQGPVAAGQAEARRFKAQLLQRAKRDDEQAAHLRGEEHALRAALSAAKTSKTHTVAKRNAAKTPAGSKSGLAKKQPTAAAKAAAKPGAAGKSAAKTPSIPTTRTGIQSRLIIVTGTIHALEQDSKKCRQMAAKL